ncbi:hypothetical protein K505DRAFT_377913 [Melanomma pulvis-pyrius CBS 109.77]|uniref:Uncharacterized protein n=1 Tax=Melanomma pulvis-pyrius CBS 109.77 TaxID=1314802 RepID=A0A6A6X0M0_9PLEO|nr:hypothetical protein K505DRAFT_377913 [Melanomma pulvis-pyrius CBS 109.77]
MSTTVALSDADAEDNQKLGTMFHEKTQQAGKAGDWTSTHTVAIRGPFQGSTAIVMQRAVNGWVQVFKVFTEKDHRPVAQYNASNGSIMIIINQNEYAWVMGNATVKYIE